MLHMMTIFCDFRQFPTKIFHFWQKYLKIKSIWYTLPPLVYFTSIWYNLPPFGIFCGNFAVYFPALAC
jgi:hypothetical protein